MKWLKDVTDDIYDPSYTDMLRVAFASEFRRGKLQDLVALLSGRNFDTKQYEEAIAEASFGRLKKGVLAFINKTHFDRFTMIVRSAGFVTADLIGAQNNLNFAYILYLRGRDQGLPGADLERLVRRWYAFAQLTRRYSKGNPETDIGLRHPPDRRAGPREVLRGQHRHPVQPELLDNLLPLELDTASSNSAFFLAYQAAQVKAGDKGFLSRDITVNDLLLNRSDVHHVYPKKHLNRRAAAAASTTRLPTSCSPRARSTSPSATSRPRSTSPSWWRSATGARRSTAASRTWPN